MSDTDLQNSSESSASTAAPTQPIRRRPGRPPITPRKQPHRIGVTIDDALYRRVAHACVDNGLNRQLFLERAIELALAELEAKR